MSAIPEDDARSKHSFRSIRQQNSRHVFAELFGAGIRIVVGTVPVNRVIFGDDFVAPLPGYSDRTYLTKAPETVVMLGVTGERQDFKCSSKIHVQTTLFRLAIERRRTVNN